MALGLKGQEWQMLWGQPKGSTVHQLGKWGSQGLLWQEKQPEWGT